jgi:itaconate CoA-transferase
MKPLDDVMVVSLERAVAAPLATRHLADLGARVIKIEAPDGGDFARAYDTTVRGMSSHFVWLNRAKESVVLDLKQDADRRAMVALISHADVFVQNLTPGAIRRLGLSSEVLHPMFPNLIICSISGYGQSGPSSQLKAYDLLVQAEAGLLSITGTPAAPAKAGIPVADIAAGMYAFASILASLYTRLKTGEGSVINVSLFEALTEWMGYPAYFAFYSGNAPVRAGMQHPAIAPYGPFTTADRKTVLLAVQNDSEWIRLCNHVLRAPTLAHARAFATNSARVRNRKAVDDIIATLFGSMDRDAVIELLEAQHLAYADWRDVQDLLSHPQLVEGRRITEVGSPVGALWALLPPMNISGVEFNMGPIPALGEHTQSVLSEFGVSDLHPKPD